MSMNTEQIKRLKNEADLVECTHEYTAKLLREAADTIEQLAAKIRQDNAYQKAFEDIREELLYTMDMCEPGNPKQDNFVGGLQIAAEILNKHDPSKKGKETHDA